MSGDIAQIVDVQVRVLGLTISKAGFGTAAFIYSKDAVVTTRVFTFATPQELLDDSVNFPEITESSELYKMAVEHYNVINQDFKPTKFKVIMRDTGVTSTNPETFAVALDAAAEEDQDFYMLHMTERGTASQTDNQAVGDWVKDKMKLFGIASNDTDIRDVATDPSGTDLADYFKNDGNGRVFTIFSTNADKYPEATVSGRNLPNDPGSVNWKFTQFKTQLQDTLNTTQRKTLDGDGDRSLDSKNANYVQKIGGKVFLSSSAVLSDGLFIDVRRTADWITAEQGADVLALLLSVKKVPNTNDGRTQVENAMRKSLDAAVTAGAIKAGYVINMPDESEQSDDDRANRWLDGITWEAEPTGAVNKVIIRGTLYI